MKRIIIGVVAGVVLAAGGVAVANIPDAGGVIHGCVLPSGQLRVIDADKGQTCGSNEKSLSWNHQGPSAASFWFVAVAGEKAPLGQIVSQHGGVTYIGQTPGNPGVVLSYQFPRDISQCAIMGMSEHPNNVVPLVINRDNVRAPGVQNIVSIGIGGDQPSMFDVIVFC